MARIALTRMIEAPPEQVFRTATDLRRAAEFVRGIDKIEVLTDGPIGLGTRFRETRTIMKRQATEEMEITAWEPGRLYAVECGSCGARYRSEFRFIREGSGTRLDMELNARPVSFFAKALSFMAPLMLGSVKKCIENDLDDVKAAAEGSAAMAPAR